MYINDDSNSSTPGSPGSPCSSVSGKSNVTDLNKVLETYGFNQAMLQEISKLLKDLAKKAGIKMMAAEHEVLALAMSKNNTADLVTHYDHEIEEDVRSATMTAFPTFKFLGEETGGKDQQLTNDPTFICDPIDGTLNFTYGRPNFAISLALAINKKPVVGVVYNPARNQMFYAVKGCGAYLENGFTKEITKLPERNAPLPGLSSCLVAVEWGNQRSGPNWKLRTDVHNALLTSQAEGGAMVKSIRSDGSAALNLCYVAQGVLDAYFDGGVYVWDVAAGWIILEEAGGIMASANPGDWEPTLMGRVYFGVRKAAREEQEGIVNGVWALMRGRKFVY